MGLLEPAGLLLALLAIPILIFYMLRLRRQEIVVSSSQLWRQVLQDRQANAPWQRLRRNWLLYLQLLVLALLVLALARPFLEGGGRPSGNLVVILDASASMQAGDGGDGGSLTTRFARGQGLADGLVDSMAPDARMTLIRAGSTPATVLSGGQDKAALHAAIAALRPGAGLGDMAGALTLATAAAQSAPTTLYVISDGALSDTALPAVNAAVHYLPVGTHADNTAITALALRDAPQGPQLFVSLADPGPAPAAGLLSVTVDGRLWDSRPITLTAGVDTAVTLTDLPLDTHLVTATLAIPDLLPLDNTAWAVRAPPATVPTMLVSPGNSFMEKALALLPQVLATQVAPADYRPITGTALTVFDGYLPATLPAGNLLLLDPPDSALLPVSGTVDAPTIGAVEASSPLLRYVDWSGVHIASARRVTAPAWAQVLVRSTAGDPLLLAGETGGRRVAALTFDLHRSDLALQVAFPILVANLVGWLAPASTVDAPPLVRPGNALALAPGPGADQVTVQPPPGGPTAVTLAVRPGLSFGDTEQPGLYRVQPLAHGQPLGPADWFAVNLLDRQESDIAPQPVLALQGQSVAGGAAGQGTTEVGPWVLALGLLLLALEWWLYHRGRLGLFARLRPRARAAR